MKEMLDRIPVSQVRISKRLAKILRKEKVATLGQLARYSRDDMLRWKGCGKRTLAEIDSVLTDFPFLLLDRNTVLRSTRKQKT